MNRLTWSLEFQFLNSSANPSLNIANGSSFEGLMPSLQIAIRPVMMDCQACKIGV
jgi:hypothetical protein